jgi:D-threonate/D-erythronate kinase
MKELRLIADDLTGALDAAAHFVTAGRPIPVFSGARLPLVLPGSFAIDIGTRDLAAGAAAQVAARYAVMLPVGEDVVAFKKVDSLLRGHPGMELASMLKAIAPESCVIAPAFPFHGRVTRNGVQHVLRDGSWQRVGEDVGATLLSEGISFRKRKPGDPVPDGVSLWDAETDDDLRRIANSVPPGPILWCGSGGLAGALGSESVPVPESLERPILGLFGSDHPVTAAQLARCADHLVPVELGGAGVVADRLAERGICLAHLVVPQGTSRSLASQRIARGLTGLTLRVPRPQGLLVAGGETLGALCTALGAERLDVIGQFLPGVPVSVMVGGRWDGVRVASKSGAFGDELLLLRILGLDPQS